MSTLDFSASHPHHVHCDYWEHPELTRLRSFLRGELSRSEIRVVVRHLLTGCAQCRQVTGSLWQQRQATLGAWDLR